MTTLDVRGSWNSWKLPPDEDGRKPGPVTAYTLTQEELADERERLGIKPTEVTSKSEVGE